MLGPQSTPAQTVDGSHAGFSSVHSTSVICFRHNSCSTKGLIPTPTLCAVEARSTVNATQVKVSALPVRCLLERHVPHSHSRSRHMVWAPLRFNGAGTPPAERGTFDAGATFPIPIPHFFATTAQNERPLETHAHTQPMWKVVMYTLSVHARIGFPNRGRPCTSHFARRLVCAQLHARPMITLRSGFSCTRATCPAPPKRCAVRGLAAERRRKSSPGATHASHQPICPLAGVALL